MVMRRLFWYSQSHAQDGAKEDADAGSDITPHTMEDEDDDEDNDSEEVGQENTWVRVSYKPGRSGPANMTMQLLGGAFVYLRR